MAAANKIAIVTDQEGAQAARAFQAEMLRTKPFKDMQSLVFEIKVVPSGSLSCSAGTSSSRVIDCSSEMPKYQAMMNADHAVIIKQSAERAGSGSRGLGVSATSGMDARTTMHEYMHTLGFADEYRYQTAGEANAYCDHRQSGPNVTFFKDHPPYASDGAARGDHGGDIPWFGKIKPATLITSGSNLGTSEGGMAKIGLYQTMGCKLATTGVKSWTPGDGGEPTIMETPSGEIPESYYDHIYSSLNETRPASSSAPSSRSSGKARGGSK